MSVGFKIVYEDIFKNDLQSEIVDYLKINNIRIIHLTRENILRAYVSRVRMGKYGITYSDVVIRNESEKTIFVDPQKVQNYQSAQQQYRESVEEVFCDQIILNATYESIENGYSETVRLLGFKNSPLNKEIEPMGVSDIKEYISNYNEVARFDINTHPCLPSTN